MSRACWSCVCAFALWAAAEAVVGGAPAAAPEPDAAVVFLQHRGLSARVEGVKDDKIGYYSFLGIRYAEPPVGPRRFQRPFRRFLTGDVAAKKPCQPCPQPNPRRPGSIMGSEDCLCLSVYTPKMPGEERGSPVIFFIHGGNYRTGSANMYGGQHLNQKDTILVTMQYRLGSLGFLSTGQKDASGNAGLFDINAAMEWVTDYITFFGGDPSRIVVMGQGSGGSAASLVALSGEGRAPRGLAAMSGAPLSPSTVRPDPGRHARSLASETNCPKAPAERLLACLRKMPSEQIVKADSQLSMNAVDTDKFLDEISGRSGAGARVEGIDDLRGLPPLISESPTDSLKNKRMRCPMLTGVTSAETSRAVFGKYNTFLSDNLKQLSDFIEKEVVGGLRNVMTGVEALVPVEVPKVPIPLAGYYQAAAKNTANVAEGLAKIAEATADALFNFPAYQSVKSWSAGAPAYLYSFEFSGNLTRGSHFLPGVALADDQTEMKERTGPSHGDELAYIFEPLDDEGNSVAGEVSSTDSRVRDAFISLIAKFAHSLAPVEKNNTKMSFLPFSEKSEQFIKIGEEITIDKDFRFCQMGLWGSMTDRVTGALCKNVFGNLLNIAKLPVELPGKLPIDVPNLPSLMGNKQTSGAKTTAKPVLGLPFRIGRK